MKCPFCGEEGVLTPLDTHCPNCGCKLPDAPSSGVSDDSCEVQAPGDSERIEYSVQRLPDGPNAFSLCRNTHGLPVAIAAGHYGDDREACEELVKAANAHPDLLALNAELVEALWELVRLKDIKERIADLLDHEGEDREPGELERLCSEYNDGKDPAWQAARALLYKAKEVKG